MPELTAFIHEGQETRIIAALYPPIRAMVNPPLLGVFGLDMVFKREHNGTAFHSGLQILPSRFFLNRRTNEKQAT